MLLDCAVVYQDYCDGCRSSRHNRRNLQTHFFTIKPTTLTTFPNLFWYETQHVSASSSAYHQELFTVLSALAYVTHASCLQTYITYASAECMVNNSWWSADELPETCWVSYQNKFGKLVRLVGFIVKKYVIMHGHMIVKFFKFVRKVAKSDYWIRHVCCPCVGPWVRLSGWNIPALTGRIFMKFDIWILFENLLRRFKFY
jgi:hypothetical protein